MSPARTGWRSVPSPTSSPRSRQVFIATAICRASFTRGLVVVSRSNGASQGSTSFFSSGSIRSQISTRPGAFSRTAVCSVSAGSALRPLRASGSLKTQSTAFSTAGTERKECSIGTGTNGFSALRCAFSKKRFLSSKAFGAAPWKEKIDCFSSPTAKIVRSTVLRAPAPAVNSDTNFVMMSHCAGLVSCASSIRMWSMPRSSL